ncbi:MAG: class I SAM-dependent methyltransferase [Planctomycetes bacterium]|nr:class I SAM-dependent methyltransferase [Planctomycetota bacterium]
MKGRPPCRVCGSGDLEELEGFPGFRRVTSDCRPWPAGGRLAGCRPCGCLQKPQEEAWEADCRAIYADYELYPQGGGAEQAVFDPVSGQAAGRSERLLERVLEQLPVAATGRLLDVGCGNGAFLRAFHARSPGWRLVGTELGSRRRAEVLGVPGVEGFHVGLPEEAPGEFDVVVLIHVLEHLSEPVRTLGRLRAKLRPGGRVVVEVPDHRRNPFELLVADHASHFTAGTLGAVLGRAGLRPQTIAEGWVPRELTVLATDGGPAAAGGPAPSRPPDPTAAARAGLAWLGTVADHARETAAGVPSPLGVLGSSLAATWLAAELGDRVGLFVDEDPCRAGRTHMGRPIVAPAAAPRGTPVYVALPQPQAQAVHDRLRARFEGLRLVVPPRGA